MNNNPELCIFRSVGDGFPVPREANASPTHNICIKSRCLIHFETATFYTLYRKIYLRMNNTARTYIRGEIFFTLPVQMFSTT